VRTHYTSGTLGGHCASDNRDGGFVFLAHSLPEPSQPLRPAPGPLIQMHEQYSSVLDPRCGRGMPGSGPPNKEQGSSIQNSWEFSPTSTTTQQASQYTHIYHSGRQYRGGDPRLHWSSLITGRGAKYFEGEVQTGE